MVRSPPHTLSLPSRDESVSRRSSTTAAPAIVFLLEVGLKFSKVAAHTSPRPVCSKKSNWRRRATYSHASCAVLLVLLSHKNHLASA
eukprot:3011931-Prymnesium_polylepis.1